MNLASKALDFTDEALVELGRQALGVEIDGLRAQVPRLGAEFARACRICLDCRGRIVVTGMGKSGHIGGKIAAAHFERCQTQVAESGRRMGEILVDFGYLKRRELLPAVRRHVEDLVYSLFGWDRGAYAITVNMPTTSRAARLPKNAASGPVCHMRGLGPVESCHSDRPRVKRSKALNMLPPVCRNMLGKMESVRYASAPYTVPTAK